MQSETASVISWLLDSDPSIRWQVMRDLLHEPAEAVAAERARIATEGWGKHLLDLQEPGGTWSGVLYQCPGWMATQDSLSLLRILGLDPASEQARHAIGLVRQTDWGEEFGNSPYFEGETEACINGRVLSCGAYFGENCESLVNRLLAEQMEDGGWNCYSPPSTRSSFHSTICVLEGFLEYEKAFGARLDVTESRRRAEEYLLERHLFRSLSTRAIVRPEWLLFTFPTHWHYDVLRALDYFRLAGISDDVRLNEALDLVRQKRDESGHWPLDHLHEGSVFFTMDDGIGLPSRWNTLRALRVLNWFGEV